MQKNSQFRKSTAEPEKVFAAAASCIRKACFGGGAAKVAVDVSCLTKMKQRLRNGKEGAKKKTGPQAGLAEAGECRVQSRLPPKKRSSMRKRLMKSKYSASAPMTAPFCTASLPWLMMPCSPILLIFCTS